MSYITGDDESDKKAEKEGSFILIIGAVLIYGVIFAVGGYNRYLERKAIQDTHKTEIVKTKNTILK